MTASNSDCSFPCTGNANEHCGAGNRLNLYKSSATPPPGPIIAPNSGLWVSLGCYSYIHFPFSTERITDDSVPAPISDNPATRTLTFGTAVNGGTANTSVQSCTDACFSSGYPLAGVEYSQECCTYYISLHFVAPVHSFCFLKTVVRASLMGVLRHLRVIALWFAPETAPSSVVAQIASICTTTREPTFLLILGVEVVAVVAVACLQFRPSLPISHLVGHTTLAGCKFPPLICTTYKRLLTR